MHFPNSPHVYKPCRTRSWSLGSCSVGRGHRQEKRSIRSSGTSGRRCPLYGPEYLQTRGVAGRGGPPSAGSARRPSGQRRRWAQATQRPQRGGRGRRTARGRGRRFRGGGGWRRASSSTGEVSEEGPDLLIHLSEIILQRWHTNTRHHGDRTATVASPGVRCKRALQKQQPVEKDQRVRSVTVHALNRRTGNTCRVSSRQHACTEPLACWR